MKTVNELIREHLIGEHLNSLQGRKPTLDELRNSEWCTLFEKLMRNRLIMGAIRYETFEGKRNRRHGCDLVGSAIERLQLYKDTGNMEHLVDAANCCMIEFDSPSHKNPNWESIDDGIHVEKKV